MAALAILLGLPLVFTARELDQQARIEGRLPVEVALPIHATRTWHQTGHAAPHTTVYVRNHSGALAVLFDRMGYRLENVRTGEDVPRIYASAFPSGLERMDTGARKSLFLRTLLPLVLKENERLRTARERLKRIHEQMTAGAEPSAEDAAWLQTRYARYDVEPGHMDLLRRRMDVVPPSLALAQAATETAWGTSRFVREGNALFGMWTWKPDVPGIVPRDRPEEARHRIRAFETLGGSVHTYIHNLNTHWAYKDFRRLRQQQRERGRKPDGLVLVQALSRYAETRSDYVSGLRAVMRYNALTRLDRASLDTGGYVAALDPTLGGTAVVAIQLPFAPPAR